MLHKSIFSNSRLLLAVCGLGLGLWVPARAEIFIALPATAAPGDVGDSFDVVLQNPGAAFNLASFTLEISTTDTDITFDDSTTGTSEPYVFAGDSFDDTYLSGISSTSAPGQTLQAFDTTSDGGNILVPADSTVGLAEVFFDVSPLATVGTTATVTFDTNGGNSLSDADGNPIPIEGFQDGTIYITVPEPSSTILFAAGLAWLSLRRARKPPAAK
jgi:hypothetical protein